MNEINVNYPSQYQGRQELNQSQLGSVPPGVSMADMANPPQTIQRLRMRIQELEAVIRGILERNEDELGLCDLDGGPPGECAPYCSDELKKLLSRAHALLG